MDGHVPRRSLQSALLKRRSGAEVRGRGSCTCFFGRALNSCPGGWGPPTGASWGPRLFTQQAVEEVSQHSFVGSGPYWTTSHKGSLV